MVPRASRCLAVVLSAAIDVVVASIIDMVLCQHKNEVARLSNEDGDRPVVSRPRCRCSPALGWIGYAAYVRVPAPGDRWPPARSAQLTCPPSLPRSPIATSWNRKSVQAAWRRSGLHSTCATNGGSRSSCCIRTCRRCWDRVDSTLSSPSAYRAHGAVGAVVGNNRGHTTISNARAKAAGPRLRPLATTVRGTLAWWPSVPNARRNAPRFRAHGRAGGDGARGVESGKG